MFKRLRNRLLIMNMSIITVIMLIAFTGIYIITSNRIYEDIDFNLHRIVDFKHNDTLTTKPDPEQTTLPEAEDFSADIPDRLISFVIRTDSDSQPISVTSSVNSEQSFYQTALETAIAADDDTGHFSLDGNTWAYLKDVRSDVTTYAFLDITTQQDVLDRLIYTFIATTAVMLGVIFLISRFLTNRSLQPVISAFDKQTQFISDASHELKTPLTVIGTNVDLLLSNQSEDSQDAKWLKYIQTEVERMGHLTRDLLYLTQMESDDTQSLMKTTFNLSDQAEHLLLGFEGVAFEHDLIFDYEVAPDQYIVGNSEQITQVIMILLDNAVKYTPKNGHVSLTLARHSGHIQLTVSNSGPGIPESVLPHIFDRFYRADKSRSRDSGSYGLGLPIAKAIIEQHGGKIQCDSVPGSLTTFTIKIKAAHS
jgi:signal transduction histidine kinase